MEMMMNMEMIPNWHPLLVHFTIALLSISVVLYLTGYIFKKPHLLLVGRWNLWIGAVFTIGTIVAGFDAYNTVTHDALSHAAMTDHKKWAIPTGSVFIGLAVWALWKHRGAETVHLGFVLIMLLASLSLAITGYKGAEVVYRHGTGVMRMPMIMGDGGHGSHEHVGQGHDMMNEEKVPVPVPELEIHDDHHETPEHNQTNHAH